MVAEDGTRQYGAERGDQQREVDRDRDLSGYRQDQTEGAERAPHREGDETGQEEQMTGSREINRVPSMSPPMYSPIPSKAMISAVIHARTTPQQPTTSTWRPKARLSPRLTGVLFNSSIAPESRHAIRPP